MMGASVLAGAAPNILGYWYFDLTDVGDFVNMHALLSSYHFANAFIKSDPNYLATGIGYQATEYEWSTNLMSSKTVNYRVMPFQEILWLSGEEQVGGAYNGYKCIVFTDAAGNEAVFQPTLGLDGNIADPTILIPTLQVDLVSTDPVTGLSTIRVTRAHAASFHETTTLAWDGAVFAGGYADPADPLNDDKIMLDLPIGSYTIGAIGSYSSTYLSSGITYNPADSKIQMVFEIV
jgi:hypothetical protein